jgi:hypothetical protein
MTSQLTEARSDVTSRAHTLHGFNGMPPSRLLGGMLWHWLVPPVVICGRVNSGIRVAREVHSMSSGSAPASQLAQGNDYWTPG